MIVTATTVAIVATVITSTTDISIAIITGATAITSVTGTVSIVTIAIITVAIRHGIGAAGTDIHRRTQGRGSWAVVLLMSLCRGGSALQQDTCRCRAVTRLRHR